MFSTVSLNTLPWTQLLAKYRVSWIETIIAWLSIASVCVCFILFLREIFLMRYSRLFFFFSADSTENIQERTVVIGIVTQIDLLNYITSHVQI